jgi:trk system potassium uptake protein TrkA
MRFVIVGAGRVGLRTARVLLDEGHDVVVVERDAAQAERARKRDITVVEGDGSHEDVLVEAGIESADAIGALTGNLNVNFSACMIGKHFGCRTVLRVDEDYREDIYREYSEEVDEIIYPERLGAIAAKNALLGGSVRAIIDVTPSLQVLELRITTNSPMLGYTIDELELPGESEVLAFGKAGEPMGIPLSDDSLEVGDRIAVLADFDVLEDVHRIIVGGGGLAVTGGD